MRVDPNRLPSGTGVYFLVIVISSLMVAFWAGQFLPGGRMLGKRFLPAAHRRLDSVEIRMMREILKHGVHGVDHRLR